MSNPKLFISYSWGDGAHLDWVLKLAGELRSQGVNVILDKWDLGPGDDANAFMESMVADPSVRKVVLICDEAYKQKADARRGGAGIEAQIITPSLFASQKQDKFVAVVREKDKENRPFLPIFYGNRIFIDLSDDATYATEFENLLRWVWDKPFYKKPELGPSPSFLQETGSASASSATVPFRRAADAIRNRREFAASAIWEYFDALTRELNNFRVIAKSDQDVLELFDKSISDFTPHRNELIELFNLIARSNLGDDVLRIIHRFFENFIPLFERPSGLTSYRESDFDNFKFLAHELFLYCTAVFIKNERFDQAAYFVNTEYYIGDLYGRSRSMVPYDIFRNHLITLEQRNQQLAQKRLSLHADLLKSRNEGTSVDFRNIMEADFILYLRGHKGDVLRQWWPVTLLYATFDRVQFEAFARAKSATYFKKMMPLLGIAIQVEFETRIKAIESFPDKIPKWQFETINPRELSNSAFLAKSP